MKRGFYVERLAAYLVLVAAGAAARKRGLSGRISVTVSVRRLRPRLALAVVGHVAVSCVPDGTSSIGDNENSG